MTGRGGASAYAPQQKPRPLPVDARLRPPARQARPLYLVSYGGAEVPVPRRGPGLPFPEGKDPVVESLEAGAKVVGDGVVLFTMFYCTLNWWTYRRARIAMEERQAAAEAAKRPKKPPPPPPSAADKPAADDGSPRR